MVMFSRISSSDVLAWYWRNCAAIWLKEVASMPSSSLRQDGHGLVEVAFADRRMEAVTDSSGSSRPRLSRIEAIDGDDAGA